MAQEYLGENPDEGEEAGEEGHQGCEGEGRCWEPPGHAGAQSGGEGSGAAASATAEAGEASASDGEAAGGEPQRCETAAAGSGPWHGKAAGVAASGGPAGATAEPAWSFVPPPERGFMSWPVEDWLEATKEGLEVETSRWEALGVLDPVAAPRAGEEASPQALDEELRRLLGMRRRWDELLGHLGLVMKHLGLSRELGFASFDHYCVERLWMAPRTVEQRVWLERRFYHLPGLREAMRAGRLSYEQARLVAAVAEADDVEDWIRRAEGMTCIALKRFIDKEEERQMCAREELTLLVPVRVAELLAAAFRAARNKAGRWLTPEECLVEIARHFTKVWKGVVVERSTPQRRARQRDELCQVPGCSRIAAQAHHIIPVSRGGTDDPWNLVGVCAAHHLVCIHRGWVRVSGRAPDQLVWQLGERTGVRPESDDARGEEVFA